MRTPKVIKVGIIYNAFDPSDMQREELVYRKNARLKTYLSDLPTDCEWKIGVNGVPVELEKDGNMRLKPDDTIQLVVIPQGGSVKDILRIVALIAVVVGAYMLFGPGGAIISGGIAGIAAMTAFVLIGSLIINAVLPPKSPKTDMEDERSYGYDGAKNTIKQGAALPVIYGMYRVAGNYVDLYTQNVGDDQYLYGRAVLSDGKIHAVGLPFVNDQPIENYSGVDWGYRLGTNNEPINYWFNRNITQINKGLKLTGGAGYVTHTTTEEVTQVQINLQFTRGLVHITDKGKKKNRTATVQVDISEHLANNWRTLGAPYTQYDADITTTPQATDKLGIVVQPDYDSTARGGTYEYSIRYKPTWDTEWTEYQTFSGDVPATTYQVNRQVGFDEVDNQPATYGSYLPEFTHEFQVQEDLYDVEVLGGTVKQLGYRIPVSSTMTYNFTDNRLKTIRKTVESGPLPLGRYDIRVRKTSSEGDNEYDIDELYLTDVGEITNTPITMSNIANAYYKIKMSEQLSSIPNVTWLVKGVEVNQYDIEGNVVSKLWTDNPAWIVLDMLIGEERGTPDIYTIDFPMFIEWAEHCEAEGLKFNGVFDTTQSLWDACVDVLKVGHAAFTRVGTKLSLAIDREQQPVMLFGPGNIFKDSFKVSYLAMTGRANEIELSYFDREDGNKQKTLRIVDPDADNRGDIPRAVQYSMVGIDNFEQAQKEAWYQIYNNRYIRRTISFDAPVESIGLSIGDVALIQHDMMNWGTSGRLAGGSTTSTIKLDKKALMEDGSNYALLIIHTVMPLSVSNTNVASDEFGANTIYAHHFTNQIDPQKAKRLVVDDNDDYEIIDIFEHAYSIETGWHYTFTLSKEYTGPISVDAANKNITVYDTDVIEERDVVFNEGEQDTVVVTSPFTQTPTQYSNYMFGVKTILKKPYRLKALSGDGFEKRSLTFVEYNENIYGPIGHNVPQPETTMPKQVPHVKELIYVYDQRSTDINTVISGVLSWNPNNTINYGGADIYVSLNDAQYVFVKTVLNVSECQLDFHFGDNAKIKVVAFNNTLIRAALGSAPELPVFINGGAAYLNKPGNLQVTQVSYLALGLVEATWDEPADLDGIQPSYRVQALLDGATEWDEYANTTERLLRIDNLHAGTHAIRIRTENGPAFSTWATKIFDVEEVPGETIDPGATVGAPPGTNVGGRPSEQVVTDIDTGAETIIKELINGHRSTMQAYAKGFLGSRPLSAIAKVLTEARIDPVTGDVYAKAGLEVSANGVVGGLYLTNNGDIVDLTLMLDKFTILRPGANADNPSEDDKLFQLIDDEVHMKDVFVRKLTASSVEAKNLALGSLGEAAMYYNANSITISGTSWQYIASVQMTPEYGKPVKIVFSAFAKCLDDDSTPLLIRVIRDDGTAIWGGTDGKETRIYQDGQMIGFQCGDGSEAGRLTTYTIQGRREGSSETVGISERFAYSEELSRLHFGQFSITTTGTGGPTQGSGGGGPDYNPNYIRPDWLPEF